jgi:hypothetical protein
LSLGKWSVDSVTIRQKSSFASPPLSRKVEIKMICWTHPSISLLYNLV